MVQRAEERHEAVVETKRTCGNVLAAQQPGRDKPADGTDGVDVTNRLYLEARSGQLAAELVLPVAPLVENCPVGGSIERPMRRNDEQEPTARLEARVRPAERLVVVGDVLEHVEADNRVEGLGQLEPVSGRVDYVSVRRVGEPALEQADVLLVGLDGHDEIGATGQPRGMRADARAELEHAPTDVPSASLQQPAVVVLCPGHPAEGDVTWVGGHGGQSKLARRSGAEAPSAATAAR